MKIKQNWELPLVAPPFCSPFWLPLWLLQGFPQKSIRKSRINFKIKSKTIKDSKDVQVFSQHFIFSDLHPPEALLLIVITQRKTNIIDRYCWCFVSALLFWERAKLLQVKKIFVKDNFSFRTNQEIS